MAKRKKTPLVVSDKNEPFVELGAIMHPMCAMVDGLRLTTFGKSSKLYLHVDEAIKWCNEEMKSHSRQKYEEIVAVLEKFKKQVADGTANIVDNQPNNTVAPPQTMA